MEVFAQNIAPSKGNYHLTDNIMITLKLKNESIASICYLANGDKSFPRERVEILGNDSICIIDDFKKMIFSKGGKKKHKRNFFSRDIGYKNEFYTFFSTIKNGDIIPVNLEDYLCTSLSTFNIHDSLVKRVPIKVDLNKIYV